MDKLLSGRKVLVVEDEMMILMMIEDMLAEMGCTSVITAASVDQALGLIHAQQFNAATLDVNLNGTKSYAVADALATRGVPFVFTTGYGDLCVKDGYGNRPILKKPFRYQDLVNVFTLLVC